jgi:pimeloyl-ACP methyl ester carboxylesterase
VTSEVRFSQAALPQWDGVLPPWPGTVEDGLHVRRAQGRGVEPALFVHGLGGASTNWTDLMGLLADTVDGEALDLPGFGWSDPPRAGSYRLKTHVDAVVRRLDRGGRGPVHLFGNSLGGAVATRVAALRPDLVRTLTLVSPAFPSLRPKRGTDPRLPFLLVPGLAQLAGRQLAKRPAERRAGDVIRLCYGDPSVVPAERLEEAVEEVRRRATLSHSEDAFTASLRGLVASYLERGASSLWQQAARVQAPTLLVWGSLDRLVDVSLAPRVAAAFPDSRLLVLPAVGHVAQLERPEIVARAFLGMREELAERTAPAPAS